MKNFILLTAVTFLCRCTFAQVPVITSFTPLSGPIGTAVTISGGYFSATAANNQVYFGAAKAVVQSGTATSLTVTVPVGATFQPVSVTVNTNIAYAAHPFIVTYAGGGMDFTASSFASLTYQAGETIGQAADLDGDHRIDLISSYSTNKIKVHRNTTVGSAISFDPVDIYTSSFMVIIDIKAGDMDGDGLLDLAALDAYSEQIYVFKNTSTPGSISFSSSPAIISAGPSPRRIAIGDLDNDGKADIACSRQSTDGIGIFRNTTTGSTITFATKVNFAVTGASEGIALGDLTGDGRSEIVTATFAANGLDVLVNTSTRGTMSFNPTTHYYAGTTQDVAIADIDGDGMADMLASNSTGNGVSIYRTAAANPLTFDQNISLPTSNAPFAMALNDLNVDGKPDIVTTNNLSATSDISVLKNTSTPGYISFASFVTYGNNTTTTSLALADLDNDGLTDISAASFQRTALSIFKNQLNINVPFPQCPTLLTPANTATINYGLPQLFTWKKDNNATGYHISITQQGGATTDVNTTDTFYSFTPNAGANYTWAVIPVNVANPSQTCTGFSFSTCAAIANTNTITPIGNTTICSNDSVQLITNSTPNSKQWFFNNQPIAGATSVAIFAKREGVYSVRIVNGSCYSNPTNISISVVPAPVTPTITVTGNATTVCIGDSLKLQSSAGLSYQWFIGGIFITGATNQQYFAKTSGNYTVKTTNADNCTSAASTSIVLTSAPTPPPPIITGGSGFCTGDSSLLYALYSTTGTQWYKNHVAIPNATSQEYYTKDPGLFTITTTQAGCKSAESNSLSPVVFSLPAKPVITSGGTSLSTTAGFTTYVWYRNNVVIPGATANQYNTTQNGIYKVTVSDINGCKNTSDDFNFVTTGLNEVSFEGYIIELFPNPVIDEFTIQVKQTLSVNGSITMTVLNGNGQNVQSQTLQQGSNTINLKTLAPGVYMVLLKKGHTQKSIKILKTP